MILKISKVFKKDWILRNKDFERLEDIGKED